MIYTEHIIVVRCDKCGKKQLEMNAINNAIAVEIAKRNGWLIQKEDDWLKERHYCPECAKEL